MSSLKGARPILSQDATFKAAFNRLLRRKQLAVVPARVAGETWRANARGWWNEIRLDDRTLLVAVSFLSSLLSLFLHAYGFLVVSVVKWRRVRRKSSMDFTFLLHSPSTV